MYKNFEKKIIYKNLEKSYIKILEKKFSKTYLMTRNFSVFILKY